MNYTADSVCISWFTVGVWCWGYYSTIQLRDLNCGRLQTTGTSDRLGARLEHSVGLHLFNCDESLHCEAIYFFSLELHNRVPATALCSLFLLQGASRSLFCKEIHHWPPFSLLFSRFHRAAYIKHLRAAAILPDSKVQLFPPPPLPPPPPLCFHLTSPPTLKCCAHW